jgi:hypothetical protein
MRVVLAILVALAIAAAGAGVASYSYSLGVAQGLAQSGKLPAPGPYPGYAYPYWYGAPFHGPFGFFGILWMVLLVFLVIGLLRGMFCRGRAWRHVEGRGVPPWFDEWHRRAHAPQGGTGTL